MQGFRCRLPATIARCPQYANAFVPGPGICRYRTCGGLFRRGGKAWALYDGTLASSSDITRRPEVRRRAARYDQETEYSSRVEVSEARLDGEICNCETDDCCVYQNLCGVSRGRRAGDSVACRASAKETAPPRVAGVRPFLRASADGAQAAAPWYSCSSVHTRYQVPVYRCIYAVCTFRRYFAEAGRTVYLI